MRLCPITMIQPGSVVARPVFSPMKGMLLGKGIELTRKDIRSLLMEGVRTVYIQDSSTPDELPGQPITEITRINAVEELYAVMSNERTVKSGNGIQRIQNLGDSMVNEICGKDNISLASHDLRGYDDYTFRHSVNVTAIALTIGRALNFTKSEMSELAMGSLLHDFGKTLVSHSILNKPGKLTQEEYNQIKRHTVWGYDALVDQSNCPPRVWAMARQHHEMLDGSGYPDKKKGEEIHFWARIITIADIWDALRSDRPYKKGWSSEQVIDYMKSEEMENKLDQKALKVFLEYIVPFPIGSMVRLSSNEVGVVIEQDKSNEKRPVVRVIISPRGKYYTSRESRDVALVKEPELSILQTIS